MGRKTDHAPMRGRRDVGSVVDLSQKMAAARKIRVCCFGTEAALEKDRALGRLIRTLGRMNPNRTRIVD
ncbi:MAG: hypothetical protein AAF415_03000 [Pseudomonadota bacterium]